MKQIVLFLITIYQLLISPALKGLFGQESQCRFAPSCSAYAKNNINEFGILKGSTIALKRLISCQPYGSKGANI